MTAPVTGIRGYVAGTWDIDPVHSHIGFAGRHMFVSKVRGRFEKFTGQIVTDADPLQSSASLTVEMNSVTTGNQTRDNDLRSDNFFFFFFFFFFFSAATYPVMTYRSTGIRHHGDGFVIDGELTIRGMTRPVSLTFEVNGFTTDPADGRSGPGSPRPGRSTGWTSASAPPCRSGAAWPTTRSGSTSRRGRSCASDSDARTTTPAGPPR